MVLQWQVFTPDTAYDTIYKIFNSNCGWRAAPADPPHPGRICERGAYHVKSRADRPLHHTTEWCGKVSDAAVFILLSFFLLACAPYERITETKYFLFLLICGGYLLIILISLPELLLIKQLNPSDLLRLLAKHRLIIGISVLYLLFTTASALLSPYSYDYWLGMTRREGLLTQYIYIGLFLALSLFGRLKKPHCRAFGVAIFVLCALCVLQLLSFNPFYLYPSGYNYYDAYQAYSGEYLGTIGNADLLSALLSLAASAFYAGALCETGKERTLHMVSCITAAVTLAAIKVSAGILSFFVTVLIFTPIILRARSSSRWKAAIAVEGVLIIGIVLALFFFDFGGSGTAFEFHELLHGRISPSFGSGRIRIWSEVLSAIPSHVLWGTGPDSMAAWDLPGFTKYVDYLGITIESGIDVAHNEYLNVLAQQGILAGASLAALYLAVLIKAAKKIKTTSHMIAFSAVSAYLIQALFSFSMCMTAPVFWAFLGLLNSEER